jgi:thiol-disulfide isomerase/thioredoxin
MRTRVIACLFLLSPLPFAGCQGDVEPPPTVSTPTAGTPLSDSGTPVETGEAEVDVQVRSWSDVQQMVADEEGNVVVVDLWSTWCEPCVREFPKLVELQQRYPEDVTCISVNLNYIGLPDEPPESFREPVLKFLQEQQATIHNAICSDPDEDVLKTLDAFAVPVVLVYDRTGQLQKTFTNDDGQYGEEGFSYERDVELLIQQLLK